ncbi:MAG: tetratricopeptide repeat protein [Pseudoxanthomonas sp.]
MTITLALVSSMALAWTLAAKDYSKAPAALVEWPLPWARGVSLDYDESSERINEIKGVGNRVVTSGVTGIRILDEEGLDEGGQGFVQSWTRLDYDTRYEKVSDPGQLILQQLIAGMGSMPLEVRLAAEGNYTGIANLDRVHQQFRTFAKPPLQRMLDNGGKPMADGVRAGLQNVFDLLTSRPVLEMQLSILPTAYNFVSRGGLGLEHEYQYQDTGPNPQGGEAYPMTGRMILHKGPLHQGWLMMDWDVSIDRERGGEILATSARGLLGEAFMVDGGKEAEDAIAQVAGNIDIGSSTRFRIDPATGIVQWMQMVQRRRVGDRNEVRSTTLTLRNEGYASTTAGKPAGASAALIQDCADAKADTASVIEACTGLLASVSSDDAFRELAYFNRARAYAARQESDEAKADLDQALRINPDNAQAYALRGALHGSKGELEDAIADFDRAISLDPSDIRTMINRGTARERSGEYSRSIEDYDRVIAQAPKEAAAWGGRCWTRAVAGIQLESALADCQRAIELDPADANHLNSRGFVYFRLDRFDLAIRDYNTAIAADPPVASSFYVRGLARARTGDRAGADADLATAVAMDPGVAGRYAGFGIYRQ